MIHVNPKGLAITRLGSSALAAVEAIQLTEGLYVESGAVQVMIYHERIDQLGGFSTKPRGQYILASAVAGRIATERLQELGFRYKTRGDGSHYWNRSGHANFRNFFAALEEMTGLVI
jgi:ribulose 1,5-bisphosphate synthetase/thiazole synthase